MPGHLHVPVRLLSNKPRDGILEMAQAIGDFQSLDRANRRAAYVHLPDRTPGTLMRLAQLLGISLHED